MGDRVCVAMSLAAFDEEQLAGSEAGRDLLAAIAEYGFTEDEVRVVGGVAIWEGTVYEANYGTASLDGTSYSSTDFPGLAAKAGLWCLVSDEGSVEWPRHHEIYAPNGQAWGYVGNGVSRVVVDRANFESLYDRGGIEAVRDYLTTGERDLADWVIAGRDGVSGQDEQNDKGATHDH